MSTPPDESLTNDRPFRVEVTCRCPACGTAFEIAAFQAEPGRLDLPRTVACPACGTETPRPGSGTLHIVGV